MLISTDGSAYGHPHAETLAWAIKAIKGVELVFNHDNEYSQPWAASARQLGTGFSVRVGGRAGVEIQLQCGRARRGEQTRVRNCRSRESEITPHGTTQGRSND